MPLIRLADPPPVSPMTNHPDIDVPPGAAVHVGRRWRPWDRRTTVARPASVDGIDSLDVDDDSGIAVALTLITLGVILLPVIVTGVAFVAELIVIAIVVPLLVLGRIALRRPWTVEITHRVSLLRRDLIHSEQVMGWRASGRRVRELRALVEAPQSR